jgi:signal transduction histidine kinase
MTALRTPLRGPDCLVPFFVLFLVLLYPHPAYTQDRILELRGPVHETTVGAHIDYLIDETHRLGVADVLGSNADAFKPITTEVPDFGYSDAMIWLRLQIENKTVETADWRLYFHENFKQIFHVYVVDAAGNVDHVLAQDRDSPFTTRAIDFPELVAPLHVPAGGKATVFVRFWTEGSTNLALSVETLESFATISARKSAKNFIFYGMMLLLIVAAFLAMLVLRHAIFPAYVGYASATLLYIMHSDGVAFQYLWSQYPSFNSMASVITGGAYAVCGALFARLFLNTPKYHPWIDKLLVAVMGVVIVMLVSTIVVDPRIIKKSLILVVLFAIALFTVSGLVAARYRLKQVRFYVIAWLGATVSAGLMTVRHWFGVEISQEFQYDSMRVVMIFDAVMMGLAIVDRFSQLRAERQEAMRASLDQAHRNLDMTQRLRDLEARYELAIESADSRDKQMKNTIHDLRQPLHALRLAVHGMVRGDRGETASYSEINDNFDYLETLVSEHLDRAAVAEPSPVDLALDGVLQRVQEMFAADARSKGLELIRVRTSARVNAEPLAIMRIISNLVSNAIKYTDNGKVLFGVRRRGNAIWLEVHDTGAGLDESSFEEACKRSVRLAVSSQMAEGHGYGLAIVTELCDRHGYRIGTIAGRRTGSGIRVEIPVVR